MYDSAQLGRDHSSAYRSSLTHRTGRAAHNPKKGDNNVHDERGNNLSALTKCRVVGYTLQHHPQGILCRDVCGVMTMLVAAQSCN